MRQPSSPFTDHDVHAALRNTGLIASHRLLEARFWAAEARALVPNCAPPGVTGGVSTQIALLGLQGAALGRRSTGVPTILPTRLPLLPASHLRPTRSHH